MNAKKEKLLSERAKHEKKNALDREKTATYWKEEAVRETKREPRRNKKEEIRKQRAQHQEEVTMKNKEAFELMTREEKLSAILKKRASKGKQLSHKGHRR